MEGIKKIKSLLKFYEKNNINIQLECDCSGKRIVKGRVTKRSWLFDYIILASEGHSQIKIFLEDIYPESIMPSDLIIYSEQKNKNKNKRQPISKKKRFKVFKRDKYTCQYCGAYGPETKLEIDHAIPISRGGTDDIDNLKTACFDCNRGKGDRV